MDTLVIGKNANKGSACCGFIQTNKHKKKSPDFAVGKKRLLFLVDMFRMFWIRNAGSEPPLVPPPICSFYLRSC